jgi:hypothetical protein
VLIAAALSRGMLERISPVYALLRDAAAADAVLAGQHAAETERRRGFQRTLIELISARGPLRAGLTLDDAADTYSALASPDLYLLATTQLGWTADRFQAWLADSLQRLLLPDPEPRRLAPPA